MRYASIHLGQTTSIVGDGAIRVGGERDAQVGKHPDGRNRYAVEASKEVAREDRSDQDEHGRHSRNHSDTQPLDDHCGRPRGASVLDGHHWPVVKRREVLRHFPDQHACRKANDDASVDGPLLRVVTEQQCQDACSGYQKCDGGEDHTLLERPHQGTQGSVFAIALFLRVDYEIAQHRANDPSSTKPERQGHLLVCVNFRAGKGCCCDN
mmetsp:Transcript_13850/g.37901  ORF Transcript_13850/g.37901 Transcript_13850/m.37901 type:complete len:209 (+) Transcript_13850:1265-1891(+)